MSREENIIAAALGIWRSKGCSCCEDTEAMERYEDAFARLIGAKRYDDDSGWDLYSEADKRGVK